MECPIVAALRLEGVQQSKIGCGISIVAPRRRTVEESMRDGPLASRRTWDVVRSSLP